MTSDNGVFTVRQARKSDKCWELPPEAIVENGDWVEFEWGRLTQVTASFSPIGKPVSDLPRVGLFFTARAFRTGMVKTMSKFSAPPPQNSDVELIKEIERLNGLIEEHVKRNDELLQKYHSAQAALNRYMNPSYATARGEQ